MTVGKKHKQIHLKIKNLLQKKNFLLLFCILLASLFLLQENTFAKEKTSEVNVRKTNLQEYTGWWIYGEGQHIFKDEESLNEYMLEFPNENMQELVKLYMAICEMEYFPMECNMVGYLKKNTLETETRLIVSKFEITYIQGCGE